MTWPPHRIVVPIDFSEGSDQALEVATTRLSEGGRIELIYVVEHLSALHPAMLWEDEDVDDAERLDRASKALLELGTKRGLASFGATTTTTLGNPAMEIARFAEACGADCVVVASHGRTGVARIAIGSVAERVVRYCKCPVLVVKTHPDHA